MVLTNFRLPAEMLAELRELRWKLRKDNVVDVVREALEEFIEKHRDEGAGNAPTTEKRKPRR
jgi:Arc/MetJ-type ribon-helix-helix transcriptional regulator